jgi:chromosome partitioning protein
MDAPISPAPPSVRDVLARQSVRAPHGVLCSRKPSAGLGRQRDRDLGSAINRAKATAKWVIVDLPGSLMRTDMAIRDADLIVIPVRPSMMDIEAVSPICELADEAGVPRVFVVNAADKDWKLLGSAIDALAEIGDVLPESLRYHEGHPASMVQGLTAAELKGPSSRVAKAEIAALWAAISKRANARKVRA